MKKNKEGYKCGCGKLYTQYSGLGKHLKNYMSHKSLKGTYQMKVKGRPRVIKPR